MTGIEHEAKVLDVTAEMIVAAVRAAGGRPLRGPVLQRRLVFDIEPGDQSRWIRLRQVGEKTTLAIKHIEHDGIDGTHEVEVEVSSFDGTRQLLALLGFQPKAYQENRRTSFELDGAAVEFDEWPLIPPYVEIEAGSTTDVIRVAGLLGFTEDQLTAENTTKVYARYGIELTTISHLAF